MNRPKLGTRLVGHTATVLTVMPTGAFGIYEFIQDTRVWPAAIVLALTMHKVMQAHEQIVAYRQWKAAWDAMGGDAPRARRSFRKPLGVLLGLGGIVATLLLLGDSKPSEAALGMAILVGGAMLIIAALAKLRGWSRRRRPAAKVTPVTVCVTRPLMAVPDMNTAYRGLPEHCLRVLRTTQ